MSKVRYWSSQLDKADQGPGAIDWTPHVKPGYLDNYIYNAALFTGELLGTGGKRVADPDMSLFPSIADAPPTVPYRARAEMDFYPSNTRIYPKMGVLQEVPQVNFGNTDFYKGRDLPYDTSITMNIAVWGDAHGQLARRVTTFKSDFNQRLRDEIRSDFAFGYSGGPDEGRAHDAAEKAVKNARDVSGALPAFMDETFVGGVPRHVFVQSVDERRSCDRYFDEKGELHRDGGKPAVIMRHRGGELLEFYENGKPHCLTGPWRQGREEGAIDENGKRGPATAVEAEYCIQGRKMPESMFNEHPDVIAARAQQTMTGRLSAWFQARVQGYQDDGADLAALRRMDSTSQLGIYLEGLNPDIRRDVIGNLAGLYHNHPGAKSLQDRRALEYAALSRRDDAAEKLLGAAGHADGVTRDIGRTRDEFAAMKMDSAVDTLDAMIGGVVEVKGGHEKQLKRADGLINGKDAFKKESDVAFDTAHKLISGTNMPGGKAEGADNVLRELERQHARLPDPEIETADLKAAGSNLTKAADDAMAAMPDAMQNVLRVAAIAERYLSTKYGMDTRGLAPADDPAGVPAVKTNRETPLRRTRNEATI